MDQEISSVNMDPERAKHLFSEGAVLIIAGVPPRTEFGIDMCSYTIDKNFRGVKMIPPGLHYIWCASVGPYGDIGPRVGFAHFFKSQEIVVREWDVANEELRERQIDEPEVEKERIRENLKELDRFLAPYAINYAKDWRQLTATISEDTLNRCKPTLGIVRTSGALQSCPDAERPRGTLDESYAIMKSKLVLDENELLPKLKPIEGTAPRFRPVPEKVPKNCTPAEITQHCMDCLAACDEFFNSTVHNPSEILGDIRLAFIFFLMGYSVESLAYWRKVLDILSHSEKAIVKYRTFYVEYMKILALHLPLLPEELMEPNEHNTVYKDVRNLLINMKRTGLGNLADQLIDILKKLNHWTFDSLLDEDPEDLPVIVELEGSIGG